MNKTFKSDSTKMKNNVSIVIVKLEYIMNKIFAIYSIAGLKHHYYLASVTKTS